MREIQWGGCLLYAGSFGVLKPGQEGVPRPITIQRRRVDRVSAILRRRRLQNFTLCSPVRLSPGPGSSARFGLPLDFPGSFTPVCYQSRMCQWRRDRTLSRVHFELLLSSDFVSRPSSPHFTSWSTTIASPARRKGSPVPKLPSTQVRLSPSPSLHVRAVSPVRGTYIASPQLTCGTPSLPARSSTAVCAPAPSSSRLSPCTWLTTEEQKCPYRALDSSTMPVKDAKRREVGWRRPGKPTLVGLTA